MNIKKLWEGYNFPRCANCDYKCSGHLNYDKLCSNLNYLEEYGEKNYSKNKESFEELKKIMGQSTPTIFSFGCGIGLDYIGAVEVFGNTVKYYGIENGCWAITTTENYKNFVPKLPNTINFNVGNFLLGAKQNNLVLCFFNSLFTISENTNLDKILINNLKNQDGFYLVCDYTINKNYYMPRTEQEFIDKLLNKLKSNFKFNCFEILGGKGIIVSAKRK